MAETPAPFRVVVIKGTPGVSYWNILWATQPGGRIPPRFPMRAGAFPPNHPVQAAPAGALDLFRSQGYWASCFPEGDGITFRPNDPERALALVIAEIEAMFGWEVCSDAL
jgi:hypothetical protein